jgi:2,6-dihydroxypseudooxynicotine hydrolase
VIVEPERLEALKRAWTPRFVSNGVEHADVVRTLGRISSWAGWLDGWLDAGALHERIGEEAESRGRHRTAGEAFIRAATCQHFGKFCWLEDPDQVRAATDRSVACSRRGLALLDPTFERLEIPFDRDRIVANLRRPRGAAGTAPFVVLLAGLDSTKEELTRWEDCFLGRGMATVSLDGPGQGEAGTVNAIRPDSEAAVGALLDALAPRADLDHGRIAIAGPGLGGYYAARAAALDRRIRAAAMIGGPYTLALRSPITVAKFMDASRIGDEEQARAHAARFTLEGIASRIAQPLLVAHGRVDAIMPWEDAKRVADEAPRGELLLYADGNTALNSLAHRAKPDVADWLAEKVA